MKRAVLSGNQICLQIIPPLKGYRHRSGMKPGGVSRIRSPYVAQLTMSTDSNAMLNHFTEDPHFQRVISKAERAILNGHYPQSAGFAHEGTYLVLSEDGKRTIGVFKPKDEHQGTPLHITGSEALLGQRLPKCLQKFLCPFPSEFERNCYIQYHAHMAETAASLVDATLALDIVPKTRIVWLRSPSFHYEKTKKSAESDRDFLLSLPPKCGSFQVFVDGYQPAHYWTDKWENDKEIKLEKQTEEEFIFLLQKMFVLDHIIRNTDRHHENWLLKHDNERQTIQLAAIDNSESFPYKHPEAVSRSCRFSVFGWREERLSRRPFVDGVHNLLLPKLNDVRFVSDLCTQLSLLLRHDDGFHPVFLEGQLQVLVGQLWNLREALSTGESPMELSLKAPMLARRRRFPCVGVPSKQWQNTFRITPVLDARDNPAFEDEN